MKLVKFSKDKDNDTKQVYGCDIECMCNNENGRGVGYGHATNEGLGNGKGIDRHHLESIKQYEVNRDNCK